MNTATLLTISRVRNVSGASSRLAWMCWPSPSKQNINSGLKGGSPSPLKTPQREDVGGERAYSFRKTLGGRTIEEKIELGDLGDLEEHSCWEGELRTGPLVRLSCYARGELCPGRVRT